MNDISDINGSSCWLAKQKRELGEAPCQNCGKMVTIMLPFLGCVFCGDCVGADSGQYDGSEQFYEKRREGSNGERT